MSATRVRGVALAACLLAVIVSVLAAPTPQDARTNSILRGTPAQDGKSIIASLILAIGHDWDLGRDDAVEFVRAVPAITLNGTSFGPTTMPLDSPGRIHFRNVH